MTPATSVCESINIPAGEGRAVFVDAGQRVRIIDLEGQQVGDVFAFTRGDVREYHSASHTRAHVNRLFPVVGEQFITSLRRPILTLVEDSSPGRHDMLIAACDAARYAALAAPSDHASCAQNMHAALATVGLAAEIVPQPINIFMDIPVGKDGTLSWETATSRPGDSITFEAEIDCVIVVSACPQDLVDINAGAPTPLRLLIENGATT
ncbi:urea carboxylase-associated family protein [Streptomyces sp. ME01-18a]|uniref:urea carboxylase-associated family protein n=1 Tax=Streptomyces sp. ME01-18a TaxID=3028669 RepID=UPI0029B53772|nr:urea carboxylase-associated family protein [Streptomyces sp. ME01-18a]MDX3434316.1 urea carboxylase-associated family protein [Streptomyces sp. ME01-18a]